MTSNPTPVKPLAIPNVYYCTGVSDWLKAIGNTEGAYALAELVKDCAPFQAIKIDLADPTLQHNLAAGLMYLTGGEYAVVIWVN